MFEWRDAPTLPVELSEKSVIFKAETRGAIFAERVYRPPLICRVALEHPREVYRRGTSPQSTNRRPPRAVNLSENSSFQG
jgi:hypothetical protein